MRTWPNEMTREAVRGLEHNRLGSVSPRHNALLPVTRLLAGHADYTPGYLGTDPDLLDGTTWAHQMALGVAVTSPLMHWADDPAHYLALDELPRKVLTSIPSTWDETLVLDDTRVGELTATARRTGETWFLAALHGVDSQSRSEVIALDFLAGDGYAGYLATFLGDGSESTSFDILETVVDPRQSLTATMRPGGGVVAMFERLAPGDANGDGLVSQADLDILAEYWQTTDGTGRWQNGDFNGDGNVTLIDVAVLSANWEGSAAMDLSALTIPEPATAVLLACGGAAVLRRRRRG
ncbi:MAG: glycoside hydrolase family 97 catalytic domain-containing protein, partial [Planctomycetota bacterium]